MDFKSALKQICHDFSKEIIFERRVISILDDHGAFKDVPYYKLFYKTILSSGNLMNLISQNNNISGKEIYTFASLTGLDEEKLKSFLSLIFECYHGIYHKPISNCLGNSKCSDNNTRSITDNSTRTNKASSSNNGGHILFMGKELGCHRNNMIKHLKSRGFQHIGFSPDGTRWEFNGRFNGMEDSLISLWETPKSKLIWKVEIRLKQPIDIIKEIYQKKYTLDGSNKCFFAFGEINLTDNFITNSTKIEYIDNKTFYIRQEERANEMAVKKQQIENERQRIIAQTKIDDI